MEYLFRTIQSRAQLEVRHHHQVVERMLVVGYQTTFLRILVVDVLNPALDVGQRRDDLVLGLLHQFPALVELALCHGALLDGCQVSLELGVDAKFVGEVGEKGVEVASRNDVVL